MRTKELLIVLFLFVQKLLIAQQGQYNIVNCKYSSVGYLVRGISVGDAEETEIYPKQNIQVNVTSVGQYSITTNTVNGIYFSANGTFRSTGLQTIELRSSGTPINYGEFTYALGDCDFKRYAYISDRRYKEITTQGQDSLGVGGINARHHRFIYKVFESATGEEWMASNLGTNYNKVGHPHFNPDAIPKSIIDIDAFGSNYQWGRYSDGHELIDWISDSDTSNQSVNGFSKDKFNGDTPDHNKMITQQQWQVKQNDELWQGESGLNNPCSVGFRIPLQKEFANESVAYNIQNINDAFQSPFKIVAPGARKYLDGTFENIPGEQAVYWTSSKPQPNSLNSDDYHFEDKVREHSTSRGFGFSVRCILLSYLFKACDYDYDGEEIFDLNTIATQIKNDYPNYKVTFYTSFFNAQVGAALGLLTSDFTATTAQNPNIIFARLEDASGKFIDGVKIKLMVYEAPKANNFKTIFYCTTIVGNTNGVFNLKSIENTVENNADYTFKYYTKEASAILGGTTDIIANPSSHNGSVGSVYVRIENTTGCFIVRAIPLAVSSMTLPAQTINIATFCATRNLDLTSYTSQLSNNDPDRYQFYFYTDQASANSNTIANAIADPTNFDASRLTDFSIWINITLNGGINCAKIVSKLNFSLIAMPDINTKPILPICAGNIITLEAETSVGNIVKWYDSENSTTPIFTGNSFTTPVLQTDTTYWIESINNSTGCVSYRIPFDVKVNALPVFSIPSDVLICENSSTILEVTTAATNTVNWYVSPTSATPFFTGHQYQTPTISSDTSFWIEVINPESCVSERTEILVETKSKVKPEFTLQDQLCKDSQPIPLPLISDNGISGTWDVSNIDTSTIGTKTYTFTPTDSCTLIFTIEITINPLPEINNVSVDRADIIVEATGDSLEYSLDGINWQTSNVISNAIVGNYKIYVRNISGCIAEYSGVLALSVNNFISPNGDGNNDYWEVKGLPNNTNVQILDRNGKILFNRKVENNFKWDGKENGKPLPSGTYWYMITLENGQKVSGYIFLKNY